MLDSGRPLKGMGWGGQMKRGIVFWKYNPLPSRSQAPAFCALDKRMKSIWKCCNTETRYQGRLHSLDYQPSDILGFVCIRGLLST